MDMDMGMGMGMGMDMEMSRSMEAIAWSADLGSSVSLPQEKSRDAADTTRTDCIACLTIRSLLLAKEIFIASLLNGNNRQNQ